MPFLPERPIPFAAVDHRRLRGRVFGVLPEDLLRHVHVLGKTGMGKSVLLEHLLVGLIRRGEGCAVIDPHGDLAERVLDLVPTKRLNDVVLLDGADTEHPVGWNPLDCRDPRARPLVASGVLGTFRKVFHDFWGPRLEHVFRNTLLALLEVEGTTLLGVVRMLVEDNYRARIADRVRDPLVRFFWTREFQAYSASFAAEVAAPVQNKVAAVLTSPVLRGVFGQRRSTVTAREIMDRRRIFVARIAKGEIGEDASAMLGAVLTTSFQLAAYARAATPPEARHRFTLVVDEFASFVSESFAELLSEARKYGLGLVLSNQYLAQLDPNLRAALLGNAGTLIAFRLGADDADEIGREFAPEVASEDLVRLDRHQIALRLAVEGVSTRAFTATTLAPRIDLVGRAETIRAVSRERYGRLRETVEEEIAQDLGVASVGTGRRLPRAGTNLRLPLR
ncbi:MAG: type IV secretion system DNA-binding domain-containing protein [Deltaproteobacteria bacterium]|nr:type IV secretion system DNA-binding domain-containing protein [Deltaproteobacteria bacterium]